MISFIENKKNYIIALAIMFVIVSLSGTTYSLFLKADNTNTFNYNTGILELEIIEDKKITLANAFPSIDSVGMNNEAYELTIKNNGNIAYLFDLKMLSETAENTIDTKYIKVMVDDNIPKTLYSTSNIIKERVIIYPKEEKKIKIRVWLDSNTPNQELGKSFIAKIATTGESTYKTLDTSGANRPVLKTNMLPVYYSDNSWATADENNMLESYGWYNYNDSIWANAITIKDSPRQIYDVTGKHNIKIDKLSTNNNNVVIRNDYLDLGVTPNKNKISNILRIKFDNINENKIYIITNENITYYYDKLASKFTFKVGNVLVNSKTYNIEENKWYIIGYTYDESKIKFYVNGENIGSYNLEEPIIKDKSFKLGTNDKLDTVSSITIGDVYLYNDILSPEELEENYKTSINIIYDSLIAGFNRFMPQTRLEYYMTSPLGTKIEYSDIESMYVWIPRYKYQLFNLTGEVPNSSTYQSGINIVFEKDTEKTGTIFCEDYTCYTDNLKITKTTSSDNGKYYNHPAFTTLDKEESGFWVGKYELSEYNNKLVIRKDSSPINNTNLSTLYKKIKKDNKTIEKHMITNLEWASITYLSHSNYGICKENICNELTPNKSNVSGSELLDSTTGNIYGVFDMAGSYAEYVMANLADEKGNLSLANSNFNNIAISNKDYNLYKKDTFILGDATKEIRDKETIWNNGVSTFIDETNNWFVRGGINIEDNPTIYSYRSTTDTESQYITTRVTIK